VNGEIFGEKIYVRFLGELQFLITAFILAKNLKSVQNICEANLLKILRILFDYGIVEKRSRDRINEICFKRRVNKNMELIHDL
jgi:hypothetical protein